ncbi:MAG TPA: ATP-binding protein [Thermoanaerobaculia bacterium]
MRPRIAVLIVVCAASLALFGYLLRQLSFVSVGLAANAESQALLRNSLADQRKLARIEPQNRAAYRRRFEDTRRLLRRMEILELTRERLLHEFELVLLGAVAAIVGTGGVVYLLEQRSRERRLLRLGGALEALSRGEADIVIGERRRDLIGRIAAMIEKTSHVMARDRRRMQYLEHLSAWQEAARRHAHEIRTPLTAAQMEVARLVSLVNKRMPEAADDVRAIETSILEELEQLRRFTGNFTSFARIGEPQLRDLDLARLIEEFAATFAPTWPQLAFSVERAPGEFPVRADRDMIRQVLVNLCSNAADAATQLRFLVHAPGNCVAVDVADDGPGIAPEIRPRLFEPYTTTRKIGEGMGLGLAISKKIMLDHGGDLEHVASAQRGATFRLTLPRAEAA